MPAAASEAGGCPEIAAPMPAVASEAGDCPDCPDVSITPTLNPTEIGISFVDSKVKVKWARGGTMSGQPAVAVAGYQNRGGRGMPKQVNGDRIWHKLDQGLVLCPEASASVGVSEIASHIREVPAVVGKVLKQWAVQKNVRQDERGRCLDVALSCDLSRPPAAKRPKLGESQADGGAVAEMDEDTEPVEEAESSGEDSGTASMPVAGSSTSLLPDSTAQTQSSNAQLRERLGKLEELNADLTQRLIEQGHEMQVCGCCRAIRPSVCLLPLRCVSAGARCSIPSPAASR
jgi:hypothetical protein